MKYFKHLIEEYSEKNLSKEVSFVKTENGAIAYNSTGKAVYDLFAFGGAYRERTDDACISLFKSAFEANREYALKCLFYLRDCRGGQGERRFFRVCFRWLINNYPLVAKRLLDKIPLYGRWDDLIYCTVDTNLWHAAASIIKSQLELDKSCEKTPSLLAKWMPSENASSKETKRVAGLLRLELNYSHAEYRKTLSALRERIKVLEKLMSENRWEEIEFDKIPSKAGLIYRNAFATNEVTRERYIKFFASTLTKVNASTLFPYEIVAKARHIAPWNYNTERSVLEKYWDNLPDYLEGEPCKMMCVVDTSASMKGQPMDVAISLGLYCAERLGGPFKNHYISFSREAKLVKIGEGFINNVYKMRTANLCENTNIESVFNLLLNIALFPTTDKESLPNTIVIISDMEIDRNSHWRKDEVSLHMAEIREKWAKYGLELPRLVYWNVNARHDNILDDGPDVTYVSGCSPTIFKQVVTGKTGIQLMLDVLDSDRYKDIK